MLSLLTHLSKIFDCLPYSLSIGKFLAYEFDETSREYLKDYSIHQKQKNKN